MKTVIAFFPDRNDAEKAYRDLENHEYNPDSISIMQKKREDVVVTSGSMPNHVLNAAITSGLTGFVIGGVFGALMWYGVIRIPGFETFLIGKYVSGYFNLTGLLSYIISAGITGALVVGVFGALIGMGIPEEKSHYFEDKVREDGVLLVLAVSGQKFVLEVKTIIEKYEPSQVRTLSVEEPGIKEVSENGGREKVFPEKVHVLEIKN